MEQKTLPQVACDNKLTTLQITTLNGIGEDIRQGRDGYESYEGMLSVGEDNYLRAWLQYEGVDIH